MNIAGDWHSGNPERDGRNRRGLFLEHFTGPAEGVRSSINVDVKWNIDPEKEKPTEWTNGAQRTLADHPNQRMFQIDLTRTSMTLEHGSIGLNHPRPPGKR